MSTLSVADFVAKWTGSGLSERSASQQHFLDLCELLHHDKPAAADPTGASFTFERGAAKLSGGDGWADVWKQRFFGWEYKGPRKDLKAAYKQLNDYREALENPPLLVVCDLDRFEVHTNFTGTAKQVYAFCLADLIPNKITPTCAMAPLEVLRCVFFDCQRLRPQRTTAEVTEEAAREFSRLASSLRERGEDPEAAARFLMRLLFCLFAEDMGLLPDALLTTLVERTIAKPWDFTQRLGQLFANMATGGSFGPEDIKHFNGSLFNDDAVLKLTAQDMTVLRTACKLDWSNVEPAIFGTLFERSLDPSKRAQLGAHYTSREDILLVIEPVLMAPLRRRWLEVKTRADVMRETLLSLEGKSDPASRSTRTRVSKQLESLLNAFADEIGKVQVLDPACGSGNFLYVGLKCLLDLWKEVSVYASSSGISGMLPHHVSPRQLHGIETNVYAYELASVVIWIGYIQWLHDNVYGIPEAPILQSLQQILHMDAVIACDEEGRPTEPVWPDADVIVGNPPFLGGKRLRTELHDKYVDDLFSVYDGRVPREADLVTYWFEKARSMVAAGNVKRVGLLATQSIRMGANRRILEQIKASGEIFFAHADRPWILDGAAIRVALVGFDSGAEQMRELNGAQVSVINSNLTTALDLTRCVVLPENAHLSFMGDTKGGSFDISSDLAATMIAAPVNPNGRRNSDVVVRWANGHDVTQRPSNKWIIDFGADMSEGDAALYEMPFEHVSRLVKSERMKNNRAAYRERWWLHVEARPAMRRALQTCTRFIATPRVAKHRIFVWLDGHTLPDSRLYVFARSDDYFFGVLHSRVHEIWSLATSSRHGDGIEGGRPTYNNTTCFETFPFPRPHGCKPFDSSSVAVIAAAARDLVAKRDAWLQPPDATAADMKKRTLTNLYNQRPAWLAMAHQRLDEAVLDAYSWPHDLTDEEILERLLALNLVRADGTTSGLQ